MKKSRLLIAVLAATMFVLAAFGFVACDKDAGELGNGDNPTTNTGKYTITFVYGEGSGTPASAQTTNGKLSTLPTPTAPANKKFDAWYSAATGGTKVTIATEFKQNGSIYARYTDNVTPGTEYTVTFNYNGGAGTPASAQTVNGKLSTLPTPTSAPDGKTFDAWYDAATGGNKVTTDKTYTEATTIFAQYTGGGQLPQPKEDGAYDGDTMLTATVAVNPENENELMITGLVLDVDTNVSIVYNEEVMTIGADISGGAIGTIAADGKSVMLAAGTYDLYYSFGGDDVTKLWANKAGGGDVSDRGDRVPTTAGNCYLVGQFDGESEFTHDTGILCENDDGGKPEGSLHQFKMVIELKAGEKVKFKYIPNEGEKEAWVGWLENDSGAFGTKLTNDNETNVVVNEAGVYTFYIKVYPDGGGSIWVG